MGYGGVANLMRWNNPFPCIKLKISSIVILACLVMSGVVFAAPSKQPKKSDGLGINIESTRPRLSVGTGFGITAEVTNLSSLRGLPARESYNNVNAS